MNPKDRSKWRIAREAARLMAEDGVHDWNLARSKAAARLGFKPHPPGLPTRDEIDAALGEHHRLYRFAVQTQHIARLRQLALEAMKFFRRFSPRLVGGVLDGTAGAYTPITIYLFPDTPEEVMQSLMEAGIPFEQTSVFLNGNGERPEPVPALEFLVDGVRVELCLLSVALKRQAIGRREKSRPRGTIEDVEILLRDAV